MQSFHTLVLHSWSHIYSSIPLFRMEARNKAEVQQCGLYIEQNKQKEFYTLNDGILIFEK